MATSGQIITYSKRTISADQIQLSALSIVNDGTQKGNYGTSLYGRVVYSAGTKAIYDLDKYDNAIYW